MSSLTAQKNGGCKLLCRSERLSRSSCPAVQPGDDNAKNDHPESVKNDLFHDDAARHGLDSVIDDVDWSDGQQRDGHTIAYALREPRLGFEAPRIDPNECARHDHVREEH